MGGSGIGGGTLAGLCSLLCGARQFDLVQKLSSRDYCFRHHLETKIEDVKELQDITWKRITSLDNLKGIVKVRINHVGDIVAVGEE